MTPKARGRTILCCSTHRILKKAKRHQTLDRALKALHLSRTCRTFKSLKGNWKPSCTIMIVRLLGITLHIPKSRATYTPRDFLRHWNQSPPCKDWEASYNQSARPPEAYLEPHRGGDIFLSSLDRACRQELGRTLNISQQ